MNYTLGDFGGITYTEADYHYPGQSGFAGISYNPGDYVTPGTSGFGGFFDTTKKFVADNQMMLLALAIAGIGIYALMDNGAKTKRNPVKKSNPKRVYRKIKNVDGPEYIVGKVNFKPKHESDKAREDILARFNGRELEQKLKSFTKHIIQMNDKVKQEEEEMKAKGYVYSPSVTESEAEDLNKG